MAEYENRTPRQGGVPHRDGQPPRQGGAPRRDGPPPKRRRRRRGLGVWGALLYVVLVIGASVLLAGLGWMWAGDVLSLDKPEAEAQVTVAEADSLSDVAADLEEKGLVEYPWLFKLFATFTHKADEIAPGTYTLDSTMDYSAMLRNMSARSAAKAEVTVTIPEGSTCAQIFETLEKNGVSTAAALEEAAANHDFKFSFLKDVVPLGGKNRLEGYLFPDTYQFYTNMDPISALNKMLLRFDEVFTDDMREAAAANGQSVRDIVTIASLIEKETTGKDQTDISEVIYNRLYKQNSETVGLLQIDATVQYILPERKEKLTEADIAIDNPYNTYKYPGLPPGPIASPGQASLRAAMNPSGKGWYFYALGDDGEHHFFKTHKGQTDFIATQELYQNAG